jgi:hypothetical protein
MTTTVKNEGATATASADLTDQELDEIAGARDRDRDRDRCDRDRDRDRDRWRDSGGYNWRPDDYYPSHPYPGPYSW